jgi:uroporphyrinogen-III synthase/GNAT superfamily N-acetyltransferase
VTDGPLDGVRVVVTRPRDQSAALVGALEAQGAEAVSVPVIEIADPPDGGAALREGLESLGEGDWVVISSPNGAARVGAVLRDRPLRDGVSVAVIGPGTRARADDLGIRVDLMPASSIAEGLLASLPDPPVEGATMLLARAEEARAVLSEGLEARGWHVRDVAAYRTLGVPVSADDAEACRYADVAAFTSASTVRHLLDGVGRDNLPPVLASIGPATSAQAAALGLTVDIEADQHTIPGLASAIANAIPGIVLLRPEPAASADAQWLLARYFDEIDDRFESGLDRAALLATPPEELSPPGGLFIAGRLAGQPVACGAVKTVEPGVADIKRMWVAANVRGGGVGRRLLRRLVAEARAMGLRRVRLDTNRALTEAIVLYRGEGFVEVPAFNDEPHADHWFALDLD